MTESVSILVPAYNEEATIESVLRRLVDLDSEAQIVVVDDGSVDRTAELVMRVVLEHPKVELIRLDHNRGKGAAVRAAIERSRNEYVVIQDADLEYDPSDIPRLLEPLRDGVADAVYGTRLRGGSHAQRAHLFWHYAGNRFLSLVTNVLYNTTISDMEVGYKAFRGELLRSFHLVSDDFRFEPEVTAKVLRTPGVRVYEVPIAYYGRSLAEGKKITWRDGIKALGALIRFRFGPR